MSNIAVQNLYQTWVQLGLRKKWQERYLKILSLASSKEETMTSVAAEAAFEQATHDVIVKITFARITECPPTRRSVDTLQKEVEHAMIKIMCPHWLWAGKFGLLAEIKPAAEYATITGGLVYVPVDEDVPSLTYPRIKRSNTKF